MMDQDPASPPMPHLAAAGKAGARGRAPPYVTIRAMEITWFGETCVRIRGREGVVAADAYRTVVGPTGRGLTADIATYSHADPDPGRVAGRGAKQVHVSGDGIVRPTSLEPAFGIDAPGEYEVH